MSISYWLVLHPDIRRPIGGVKQMHRLAEAISSYGRSATIIQDDAHFHPGWFSSTVDTISLSDWIQLRDSKSLPNDSVIIFPETFIHSASAYAKNIPSIIFNQNSSYTFGLPGAQSIVNPAKTLLRYRQPFIKYHLCVSRYDENFLASYVLPSNNISYIVNGLEDALLQPLSFKKKRIVYMPRKNKFDSIIVRSLIENSSLLRDWSFVPLDGLSHEKVIGHLRSSLIFLSFGHPEGFGLPVAEALASGCAVIGYSGLGGRELFKIGHKYGVADEVAFGDWSGFLSSVLKFNSLLDSDYHSFCKQLLLSSNEIKAIYNLEQMNKSVHRALDKFEAHLSTSFP